jgi:hypothetical protein
MHCKFKFLYPIFLLSFLVSCNNSNTEIEQNEETLVKTISNLPADFYNQLVNQTAQIDFIFHDLPISLNFYEKKSIIQMLDFMDRNKEIQPGNCKPQALVIFTSSTDAIAKAEFFFDENCTYFAFYNDDFKHYKYIVPINEKGLDYFTKVVSSARSNNK